MKALIALLMLAAIASAAEPSDLTLWYSQPAKKGMNEALPIGNGRLGALIYGGVNTERWVLNESSLWTGDEATATGSYDKMGSYQMLGELLIGVQSDIGGPRALAVVTCPSGHKAFHESEELDHSVDGKPDTKWCVEHHDKPIVWQAQLPEPKLVKAYSFTSANDTPKRDPSTWELDGSIDGREWISLDKHLGEPPHARRGESNRYAFANTNAYRFYRFTFQPNSGMKHFQVAEIGLEGVQFGETEAPAPSSYRRALDLATATHVITYQSGQVAYRREAFASHPDQVLALRLSADKPGACTGSIALRGSHHETAKAVENALLVAGSFESGLKYETQVAILPTAGKLSIKDDTIEFAQCDSVEILVAGATDYVMDYARKYHGADPHVSVTQRLESAAAKSFEQLKSAHVADFQSLFGRVSLDLGHTPAERLALPTNERKVLEFEHGGDPQLEATLFQYGRYLLISCSRPGNLPANLQGLWCDSNTPPWHSDYHANINVQMNYWPAEPANLSECHTTLFDLIQSQLEPWRKATAAAKEFAGSQGGWAVRTSHGIMGDMGWQWDITANAWYCQHFWMHYEFTGDKAYLAKVAYPVMKEITQFWASRLKKLEDGRLVVPNGWSPEHGPHEDGVSYSQEIVWDLFNNYVTAAKVLGTDTDYAAKISEMRDKLVTPKIGKWGQLQEWMTDRDDPNDHHRHTSHLFAVYPGQQISIAKTPELAAAAKKSLIARGEDAKSDVREWSLAWRCALYARLHDAENAHRMVQSFLGDRYSCLNLFGLHPPMQMDGNFGITAGICEMLVQSHEGEINLLPALPKAWPSGSVRGLRARGGFVVDLEWKDGQVSNYRIASSDPKAIKIRVNGEQKSVISVKL